jgi:hypothetical protein
MPDTAVPLWTKLWPNAVLHTVFGLALAVPLTATRASPQSHLCRRPQSPPRGGHHGTAQAVDQR